MLNTALLNSYNPQANPASEAESALQETLSQYKSCFYALRQVMWKHRDRKATFWEALQAGELNQYKIAPGRRQNDGGYSQDEWDTNALNLYLYNKFNANFEQAFALENIQNLRSFKEVRLALNELLEYTLENYGNLLLGDRRETEEQPDSLQGIVQYAAKIGAIQLQATLRENERQIILTSPKVPDVIVMQKRGRQSWQGSINLDSWGIDNLQFNSQQAETFSQMMALAARLNIGIKDFIANPEAFLGIDDTKARVRNLQRIKAILLQMNKDYLERRNAQKAQKQAQKRYNDATDAAHIAGEQYQAGEMSKAEFEAEANNADRIASETRRERQAASKAKPMKVSRIQQQELEAQQWLERNPEYAEDIDLNNGFQVVDVSDANNIPFYNK